MRGMVHFDAVRLAIRPTWPAGSRISSTSAEPTRSTTGPTDATGTVPRAGDLLVAQGASDHWKVSVAGRGAPRSTVYGWANQFPVSQAGKGSLTYETPITRRLLLVGQIALWLVALVAWRRTRGVRRREVGS